MGSTLSAPQAAPSPSLVSDTINSSSSSIDAGNEYRIRHHRITYALRRREFCEKYLADAPSIDFVRSGGTARARSLHPCRACEYADVEIPNEVTNITQSPSIITVCFFVRDSMLRAVSRSPINSLRCNSYISNMCDWDTLELCMETCRQKAPQKYQKIFGVMDRYAWTASGTLYMEIGCTTVSGNQQNAQFLIRFTDQDISPPLLTKQFQEPAIVGEAD